MKRSLPILALLLSAAVSHAWDLKPDPPADKPWAPQPDLDVRVEKFSSVVGFAQQNGPFVFTQRPDRRREVFDLRTGQSVAKYTPLVATGREFLSPGGTLSAIASGPKGVRLLELATGKERPAVAVEGAVVSFAFASDARLVVVGVDAGKRYVALFDTATGKESARHPIDPSGYEQFPSLRPMAVSPGGKHLAVRCDAAINVYDLADGKKLATLELPELTPGVNRQPGAVAVAFSADGRELAAVVRKAGTEAGTLIVWDTTDGKKTEHPLDKQTSLDPVLSGGWVVGFEVLKGGKKTPLPTVKELPSVVRLALSPDQVIALDTRGQNPVIRTFGGSGGRGTPSGAKEVPTDATAKWDAAMKVGDPVPPSTGPHWSARVGDERVATLTLALDGRRAFVESADSLTPGVGVRTVRVVEPGKPEPLHTFALPVGRIVIGETATSDAILTTDVPGKANPKVRLQVYTAEGKTAGDGWVLPFASELPTYAGVASPTRVVTIAGGRITAWQVPEGKAVWTTTFGDANGGGISPDGKVLFVAHPGGVRAIDVDTGKTVGNLKSGGLFGSPPRDENRLAFSGDRQQLAMLSVSGRTVRVWDLTTGTQTATVSLQAVEAGAPIRFLNSRFLLVGDGVYDLTDRRKVWGLKGPTGKTVVASGGAADGRLWCAVSARGGWSVAAAPFPADDLARALDGDDPTGGRFPRGEKVKLEIEAPADAPPGWDAQARAAARRALGTAKLTEDPAATTVVRVTFATVPGESVKMKWQGIENFGREETIKKFSIENRGMVIRNGQTAYTAPPTRTEMRIKEWPQVNEIDDDSKSGQEFFTRQVWRNAAFSSGFVFTAGQDPKKVGDRIMGKPDGEATLAADALTMNWPAGMEPKEPKAVDGDPSLNPNPPTPTGAVGASAWVLWVVGGGCGGLLLAAGAVVLILVLGAKRRKKLDDERPRRKR